MKVILLYRFKRATGISFTCVLRSQRLRKINPSSAILFLECIDYIQQNLLLGVNKDDHWRLYTSEADMLNVIVYGKTASKWKAENPDKEGNQRDHASYLQNAIIANLEFLNTSLIHKGMELSERMDILKEQAEQMKSVLSSSPTIKRLDKK